MTIGGDRFKEVMDTDKYHQGERMKSKEHAYAREPSRDLQRRGRVTNPSLLKIEKTKNMKREIKATKRDNDQPMTMIKICQVHDDQDQDCQEHDDQDGSQDIPQDDDEEDDHDYQDNDDEGDDPYHQDRQESDQEDDFYNTDQEYDQQE